MSDLPERVWITGYDSDPASRWWSETPIALGRAEYVRAVTVQTQIAEVREAALQDAISHVRQALIDDAHQHGSIVTTRSSAMFTAEIIATNALSRIRKGDQP